MKSNKEIGMYNSAIVFRTARHRLAFLQINLFTIKPLEETEAHPRVYSRNPPVVSLS